VVLTPGNVDDRKPVKKLLQKHQGKFYGDQGYISQALALELRRWGVLLITKFKKNMNNKLMKWADKQLLRKRAVIESVIGQLTEICYIEHSRHRSPTNFMVNLLSGLIAYCHFSKKPSIAIDRFALSASS
jgi:IS5 family transposase